MDTLGHSETQLAWLGRTLDLIEALPPSQSRDDELAVLYYPDVRFIACGVPGSETLLEIKLPTSLRSGNYLIQNNSTLFCPASSLPWPWM
jgi:hypothetical protein